MKTMVLAMGVVVVVIGLAGVLCFGVIDARRVKEEPMDFRYIYGRRWRK